MTQETAPLPAREDRGGLRETDRMRRDWQQSRAKKPSLRGDFASLMMLMAVAMGPRPAFR